MGITLGATAGQSRCLSNHARASTPAGTACGSASAICLTAALVRLAAAVIANVLSTGTTTTNRLPKRLRPGCRVNPILSGQSVHLRFIGQKKTSAGAPSSICRASVLDAPRFNTTCTPVCAWKLRLRSVNTSLRLAAANTVISVAEHAGGEQAGARGQDDCQEPSHRGGATTKSCHPELVEGSQASPHQHTWRNILASSGL